MFVWYRLAIVGVEVLSQSKRTLVEKFEGLAVVRRIAALVGRPPPRQRSGDRQLTTLTEIGSKQDSLNDDQG